ncbi:hypothetical protein AgCh_003911 [Apium graveolens]
MQFKLAPMARQTDKSPKLEKNSELWVNIGICKAEDIDKETIDPAKRFYSLFVWIGPRNWIETNTIHGSPDLLWNVPIYMPLDELVGSGYLGLEIYRSSSDGASTSTGKVLVARTLIPFKKNNDFNKHASYELRVLKGREWVAGGSITVATEVKEVYD